MTIRLFGYEFATQKSHASDVKVAQFLPAGGGMLFTQSHRPQYGLRTWSLLTTTWERRYMLTNYRLARSKRIEAEQRWMGPNGDGFNSPREATSAPSWKH